jgi:hypothetical protein
MIVEAPRAPYRPFNWRLVLRYLAGAVFAGLMSAVAVPATWGELADIPPRDVIGWSWPLLWSLGLYDFVAALVYAALVIGAVFGVISEFRAWWRQ